VSRRLQLDAAYRATAYTAETPAGRIVLRVDEVNGALDRLLADSGVVCWAYLSAHNPGSTPLSPAENDARHRELLAAAETAGHPFHEGAGVGEGWPAETSLLILGISEPEAVLLARRFEQLAILVGRHGDPVRLVWLEQVSADGDAASGV
jgi:hypothetical protein